MNNRKLNPLDVSKSLLIGNPEQTKTDIVRTPSLPSGYALSVSVNDIDFFEKNPRHTHDLEMYAQLKESIRAKGVQQPVHITKRPGSGRYVLAQGGNTRLKIAQELLAETGDSRFAQIPCIYVTYTSDEDILIAHLIENEQRAEMSFWDKACAYAELRDVFQNQQGKELSSRALDPVFKEHGITLHYTKLSAYLSAFDKLAALNHLCIYLSLPKSLELRKQFNELKQTAKDADAENEAFFDVFWDEALSGWAAEHGDDTDLDLPALQQFIAARFKAVFVVDGNRQPSRAETASPRATPSLSQSSGFEHDQDDATEESGSAAISDGLNTGTPKKTAATPESQSGSVSRPPVNLAGGAVMRDSPTPASGLFDENQPEDAVEDAPPRSRDQIQSDLIAAVKRLLATVNLEKLLIIDHHMPYGFLLDIPNFNQMPWKAHFDENINYGQINTVHPYAGAVFYYLWMVSSEDALFYEYMELPNQYNPFISQNRETQLQPTWNHRGTPSYISQVFVQTLNFETYQKDNHVSLFEFVVSDAQALSAYCDFLALCAELEHNGGDNIDFYEANQ